MKQKWERLFEGPHSALLAELRSEMWRLTHRVQRKAKGGQRGGNFERLNRRMAGIAVLLAKLTAERENQDG